MELYLEQRVDFPAKEGEMIDWWWLIVAFVGGFLSIHFISWISYLYADYAIRDFKKTFYPKEPDADDRGSVED